MSGATAVRKNGYFGPAEPAPTPQAEGEPLLGAIEGTSTLIGTVTFEGGCTCSGAKLKTETQIIDTGPLSDEALVALLQGTTADYEAQGYLIMAHSLLDVGGSRVIGLTIGWYETSEPVPDA